MKLDKQDLRAIVAAILDSGNQAPTWSDAVFNADSLLAELERTAEPEECAGDKSWVELCDCGYRMLFTQNLARACPNCGRTVYPRSEVKADKIHPKVKNPCGGLEFDVKRFDATDNGLMYKVVRMKMEEMIAAEEAELIQKIKDEGAKAERERIIAMMVAWDGNERVYNTRGRFDALALRAALEPKP